MAILMARGIGCARGLLRDHLEGISLVGDEERGIRRLDVRQVTPVEPLVAQSVHDGHILPAASPTRRTSSSLSYTMTAGPFPALLRISTPCSEMTTKSSILTPPQPVM